VGENGTDYDLFPQAGTSTYTNKSSIFKVGAAMTLDFSHVSNGIPLRLHFNYGYRGVMGEMGEFYPGVQNIAFALELTPVEILTIWGEFYWDMPTAFPKVATAESDGSQKIEEGFAGTMTGSAGAVLHLGKHVDLQVGAQLLLTEKDKYLRHMQLANGLTYSGRLVPDVLVYGGFAFNFFVVDQDMDKDGVVDGLDKCIDVPGPPWNDGCEAANPDPDEDGVCSSWVPSKGADVVYYYSDLCEGEDMCPNQAGELANDGCPVDEQDPDPDGDGVCDAWVSQDGLQEDYADICTGIDKCPLDKGSVESEGCQLDNPDVDGDKVCDPWVSQKKKLSLFKGTCSGYDDCPSEPGTLDNKGCPLENPDLDGDKVCDAWVSQKKQQKVYKDQCQGVDQCPSKPGKLVDNGCPEDDPDPDQDGVCDAWVAQKKMQDKYKDVCANIDQCPTETGAKENNGCPWPNPDPDGDGFCDAWVQEKKLAEQFKDKCIYPGVDKCPLIAGENEGCEAEPEPDLDGDGLCDEWVASTGQTKKFAKVCKGIDKCPNVAGKVEFEGCAPPPIEEKVNLMGVTFGSGNAKLTSNAKKVLNGVADQLNAPENAKVKIRIEGHTDSQGSDKSNQTLSEKRAKAVVDYLAARKVDRQRMSYEGLGESSPIADNDTEEGREENRRIEMHRVHE
jgi:outer membrane protein OmpA-like peptidoglycan-associated protein